MNTLGKLVGCTAGLLLTMALIEPSSLAQGSGQGGGTINNRDKNCPPPPGGSSSGSEDSSNSPGSQTKMYQTQSGSTLRYGHGRVLAQAPLSYRILR